MSEDWEIKICCMGAGYVGGPTMAVIAKQCPKVRTWISCDSIRFDPSDARLYLCRHCTGSTNNVVCPHLLSSFSSSFSTT
jgi:UDP-glucose/GDP-mannose dehydrogenase family, NAD binding domain